MENYRDAEAQNEYEDSQLIQELTASKRKERFSYKRDQIRDSRNLTHKQLPFKGDKSSVTLDMSET